MLVCQAGHAKCWIALVSVRGRSGCAGDLSCLPLKDGPGRREQMPSGRASTIGSPALRTKKSCRGICMKVSCITVSVHANKNVEIAYNLSRQSAELPA